MLFTLTVFTLPLAALAHGPDEAQVMAATLDEHARYTLLDPLPEDCDAPLTVGPAELMDSDNRQTVAAALEALAPAAQACYQLGLDDAEHPAASSSRPPCTQPA